MRLAMKALVNHRNYHSSTHAVDWRMQVDSVEHGLCIRAWAQAAPFYLISAEAAAEAAHSWYCNFDLAAERYRGLDDREDHLHGGTFRAELEPGESVTLVLSTRSTAELGWRAETQGADCPG
jgi:hypothetical protein